ncbi:hypothetical protein WJX81_000821 [Elliptochloris bilobata]|uniref:Uncharacterized protein n=1 Tax=Elliptochloris bilobata TaxID=381761 RepID=A0AAW1SKK5_9CHLO
MTRFTRTQVPRQPGWLTRPTGFQGSLKPPLSPRCGLSDMAPVMTQETGGEPLYIITFKLPRKGWNAGAEAGAAHAGLNAGGEAGAAHALRASTPDAPEKRQAYPDPKEDPPVREAPGNRQAPSPATSDRVEEEATPAEAQLPQEMSPRPSEPMADAPTVVPSDCPALAAAFEAPTVSPNITGRARLPKTARRKAWLPTPPPSPPPPPLPPPPPPPQGVLRSLTANEANVPRPRHARSRAAASGAAAAGGRDEKARTGKTCEGAQAAPLHAPSGAATTAEEDLQTEARAAEDLRWREWWGMAAWQRHGCQLGHPMMD